MSDGLAAQVRTTLAALRRATAARHRLEADRARGDMRTWVVKRRERTRQLIELGELIAKSGIVELVDDDRAVIFGALLEMSMMLPDQRHGDFGLLWQRRGRRGLSIEPID